MGQKINPTVLRLGPVFNWSSRWFDEKNYEKTLLEDIKVRKALMLRLSRAGVSSIEIERSINNIKVIAFVSRPGIVIGRGGSGLEDLKEFLYKLLKIKQDEKNPRKIDIRVEPIKDPSLDAYLVAKNISDMLIRRMPHRRIMAQTVEKVMNAGAKGVRIVLSGRIGGAEIGRREKLQKGKVPLSTIRELINFASVPALTKKGYIGVKVWINKQEEK
ncbi:30S ribosomal protein S3 [Patescibacteria group bacterium]|nr:30S ribosomal protein S3 [Patescibacteria group bacterium]